jgi:hypothetical protein
MKTKTKSDQRRVVLTSPEGTRIIGTLERLSGRAEIVPDSFRANPQGGFTFEYEGTTEVFWDGQETEVWDGERVFLDGEGNEFREDTLRLVPEDSIAEASVSPPMQPPPAPRVIVIMKDGGIIESVLGVPPGVYAQVIDLDGEGAPPETVTPLAAGRPDDRDGIRGGAVAQTIKPTP